MSAPEYQVTIQGEVNWDLIHNYDNTGNNVTTVETVSVTTTESIEYSTFEQTFNSEVRKEVEASHVGSEIGATYEGISAKVNASIDVSSEVVDTLQETTNSSFKSNYSKTSTYSRTITVGPNGKSTLYQQRFTGPGITVAGGAFSTTPLPTEAVTIDYVVRPIRFIKSLTVQYGGSPSEAPGDRVIEYSGQNDDINAGYGGKYVWLVPVYTYNAAEAAVRFDLFIQDDAHSGWSDLASGAGGSYRYLNAVADASNPVKITDLKLYRSNDGTIVFPAPYTGHTSDINANRKKTFLYLLWATRTSY